MAELGLVLEQETRGRAHAGCTRLHCRQGRPLSPLPAAGPQLVTGAQPCASHGEQGLPRLSLSVLTQAHAQSLGWSLGLGGVQGRTLSLAKASSTPEAEGEAPASSLAAEQVPKLEPGLSLKRWPTGLRHVCCDPLLHSRYNGTHLPVQAGFRSPVRGPDAQEGPLRLSLTLRVLETFVPVPRSPGSLHPPVINQAPRHAVGSHLTRWEEICSVIHANGPILGESEPCLPL